jgi:hypothetical protein
LEPEKSPFNRSLLIILVVLFLLTISAMLYVEWTASAGSVEWWMLLLNALILSIPLGLLFGSIYVLAAAWREHARPAGVSPRLGKVIHWAPRLAAMLIIFFASLFSWMCSRWSDAAPLLGAFPMHNIPPSSCSCCWSSPEAPRGVLASRLLPCIGALCAASSPCPTLIFVLPILLARPALLRRLEMAHTRSIPQPLIFSIL